MEIGSKREHGIKICFTSQMRKKRRRKGDMLEKGEIKHKGQRKEKDEEADVKRKDEGRGRRKRKRTRKIGWRLESGCGERIGGEGEVDRVRTDEGRGWMIVCKVAYGQVRERGGNKYIVKGLDIFF